MKPCPWPSLIRSSLSLLPLPASEAILRTGRTACHADRPSVGHSSVAVSACMAAFALDARLIPRHSAASAPAPGVNRTPLIVGGKAAITLFSHRFFKIDYIIVQRSLQAHYGLRPQCRPRLSAYIFGPYSTSAPAFPFGSVPLEASPRQARPTLTPFDHSSIRPALSRLRQLRKTLHLQPLMSQVCGKG